MAFFILQEDPIIPNYPYLYFDMYVYVYVYLSNITLEKTIC